MFKSCSQSAFGRTRPMAVRISFCQSKNVLIVTPGIRSCPALRLRFLYEFHTSTKIEFATNSGRIYVVNFALRHSSRPHFCISTTRLSSKSPRRHAASTLSGAMRQRVLAYLAQEIIALPFGAPIAKRRTRTMHRDCIPSLRRRTAVRLMSDSGVAMRLPGKTIAPRRGIDSRRAIAREDSGTRCSLPAFMRAAGMIHNLASRSNSSQVATRTSTSRRSCPCYSMFSGHCSRYPAMLASVTPREIDPDTRIECPQNRSPSSCQNSKLPSG